MSKIVPKLNLNKTPQIVDNNSLIFAKNVRLLSDNTIGADLGFTKIIDSADIQGRNFVGIIVGLDNIVYIFTVDSISQSPNSTIYEYNELTEKYKRLDCGWTYSGGKIDGYTTKNNAGDVILTVCEYDAPNKQVPIKHINVSKLTRNSREDDESIYTQTPNIPFTNINFEGYYDCVIPNGVYQFFVRYKVDDDTYTAWFPCSGELYAYKPTTISTVQGQLKYVELSNDCPRSFKLSVEHLNLDYIKNFKEYQLGFVISSKDSVVARRWKSFIMSDNTSDFIYFDYKKEDIEEEDIDKMLETLYEIFDVNNITYYKNKLYISNYKETDFNPPIDVSGIGVSLSSKIVPLSPVNKIAGKELTDPVSGTFTKCNGKNISELLKDNNIIDFVQTSSSTTSNTIKLFSANAYWHDEGPIDSRNADVFYLNNGDTLAVLNNKKLVRDLSTGETINDWLDLVRAGLPANVFKDNNTNPFASLNNFKHKWYWRCGSINYNVPNGNGYEQFVTYPYGLRGYDEAVDQWKNLLLESVKNYYSNFIITQISYKDANSNTHVLYDGTFTTSNSRSTIKGIVNNSVYKTKNNLEDTILSEIIKESIGVDASGHFYIKDTNNNNYYQIANISVKFLTFSYNEPTVTRIINTETTVSSNIVLSASVTTNTVTYSLNVKHSALSTNYDQEIYDKTLMPFTDYEFYIHFVKSNGVITNGYYIGTKSYKDYVQNGGVQIIYPIFTNIPSLENVPGYKGFFISCYNSKNQLCKGFNHYVKDGYHYMDVLEIDTNIYPLSKNIIIGKNWNSGGTEYFQEEAVVGEYISSGNNDVDELFGSCGTVRWPVQQRDGSYNYESIVKSVEIPLTKTKANGSLHIRTVAPDDDVIWYDEIDLSSIDLSSMATTIKDKFPQSIQNYINVNIQTVQEDYYIKLFGNTTPSLNNDGFYIINRTHSPIDYTLVGTWDINAASNTNNLIVDIEDIQKQLDDVKISLQENKDKLFKLKELESRYRCGRINSTSLHGLSRTNHSGFLGNLIVQKNLFLEQLKQTHLNRIRAFIEQKGLKIRVTDFNINRLKTIIANRELNAQTKLARIQAELASVENARLDVSLIDNGDEGKQKIEEIRGSGAITHGQPSAVNNHQQEIGPDVGEYYEYNYLSGATGAVDIDLKNLDLKEATFEQYVTSESKTQLNIYALAQYLKTSVNIISEDSPDFVSIDNATTNAVKEYEVKKPVQYDESNNYGLDDNGRPISSATNDDYWNTIEGQLRFYIRKFSVKNNNLIPNFGILPEEYEEVDSTENANIILAPIDISSDIAPLTPILSDETSVSTNITSLTNNKAKLEDILNAVKKYPDKYIIKTASGYSYNPYNFIRLSDTYKSIILTINSQSYSNINKIQILDVAYSIQPVLTPINARLAKESKKVFKILNKIDLHTNNIIPVSETVESRSLYTSKDLSINKISYKARFEQYPTVANTINQNYWVVIPTNTQNSKNKTLTKITPYVLLTHSQTSYSDYSNMNLPAFICGVKKLNHNRCNNYYVSGNDIYEKVIENDTLTLKDVNGTLSNIQSNMFYVPSNYNLNCVSLNDELIKSIRTYQELTEERDDDGNLKTITKQHLFTAVNSLTASSILTLTPTFYDYTRKYYSVISNNNITDFENTIRSSDVDRDEEHKSVYKFDSEDYYMIPTNRGSITKLFSLNDNIYIHTKHSLYKFTGSNSLSSSEGDVQLKEQDVFESGIVSVLDAQFGYGGLNNKQNSIITFNAYVFYDYLVKSAYAFDGQHETSDILNTIYKLIHSLNITDVIFLADEEHDRFFVNFKINDNNTNKNICLSYNLKTKDFISIHDFDFELGFNTRHNSYVYHAIPGNNGADSTRWVICKINKDEYTVSGLSDYKECYVKSALDIDDTNNYYTLSSNSNKCPSVIDIIVNTSYEKIKSLDYINWICNSIVGYSLTSNFISEETFTHKYAGHAMRIYTDECSTALIELVDGNGNAKESNKYIEDYTNPRYNCGVWSFNYFRDVKNILDLYNYKDSRNKITGGSGHSDTVNLTPRAQRQNLTQENSLIYGKYFVIRFIFKNNNFKLENIDVKINDYGKVK